MRRLATGWFLLCAAGCVPPEDTGGTGGDDSGDPGDTADTGDTAAADFCADNGFGQQIPWNEGPYGTKRHEIAEDFVIPQIDGTEWSLKEHWSGCENYLFVPDSVVRTVKNNDSVWTKDLDDLIEGSPRNTHYFFVSVERDSDTQTANLEAITEQVDKQLGNLDEADAAWWKERLHVSSVPASDLQGWLKTTLRSGVGRGGLGIDRYQQVRGFGSLADDTRADLSNDGWPFQNNLAFAAHEARYFNMEAARQALLDAQTAPTLVQLWNGEVIDEYEDMEVELPSASEMAGFDTFELDIDMRCPDPDKVEQGNCGAWDYIANLYVKDIPANEGDPESWTELSRFITSYHRETHWVVDATPMMAHLLDGGKRTFRWSWAPSWNTQPTETRLQLRFSNQGKPYKPRKATLVATGGAFGSTYNDGRVPVDVAISAEAKKVELWAIISGHGMETHNCAEFCNHQHEFTIDGATHLQEYAMAGTEAGCVSEIENQMVPNQSGTWWYGRGGWCPGEPVHPYAVDVTSEVGTDGTASVAYRGLYGDDTPDDISGTIVLNAWLIEYD